MDFFKFLYSESFYKMKLGIGLYIIENNINDGFR